MADKLRASDVLDWNYLVRLSEEYCGTTTDRRQKLAFFAYNFTSTSDEAKRDAMLLDLLQNGTAHQSKETAEEVVRIAATNLKADHETLRRFAKENGVRLKRG